MKAIDINCDMGEGFGAYAMGSDTEMLNIASTANLACGYHGGDPMIMSTICKAALSRGVAVGAHPGYPDLWGFGRREIPFSREERKQLVAYQIGALAAVAKLAGHRITHVKAHGALGHLVADNEEAAADFAEVIAGIDSSLRLSVMAGSLLEKAGIAAGLQVAREIYVDRAYTEEGRLLPRSQPGAVIHDAEVAMERVANMVAEGCIITQSGKRIPVEIDTVCVHGDSPGAVPMAKAVRKRLVRDGWTIQPYAGR
ncbi:LamB/YcsF family protein [Caballeronia glebae]|uniref:5-oxoprolinase subunit A n=1 Tax=Caballeronia glebae TaxID=1777143 RepID=A0A158AZ38_9BURK|nr:5-oxoprolinase subunit PxpA [Caballeronia glebae]SAK63238.1 LamB/YcsF family protein [Caballeronia glebae]